MTDATPTQDPAPEPTAEPTPAAAAPTSASSPAADGSTPPLVSLRNIHVAFGGVHAVEDVSIDLHAGEVVAVVGGNGAGKSTLMHTLSGAHPADSGEIVINGQPVTIHNPREARQHGIEVIYQKLALADNLDAADNVFLGRELRTRTGALDDPAMASATAKVLKRLNPMFKNLKTPVKSLSGGQRQSVAIARAVHFNARILIMDEPTAALGVTQTRQVLDLIKRLAASGVAVMVVSHNLNDVFEVADRIAVMYLGTLVVQGPASEFNRQSTVEYMTTGRSSRSVEGRQN